MKNRGGAEVGLARAHFPEQPRVVVFWFIIHQYFLRGKVQEETCC